MMDPVRSRRWKLVLAMLLGSGAIALACDGELALLEVFPSSDSGDGEDAHEGMDATADDGRVADGGTDVIDASLTDVVPDAVVLRVATPTFTPAPGTFTQRQCVSLESATPGATLFLARLP